MPRYRGTQEQRKKSWERAMFLARYRDTQTICFMSWQLSTQFYILPLPVWHRERLQIIYFGTKNPAYSIKNSGVGGCFINRIYCMQSAIQISIALKMMYLYFCSKFMLCWWIKIYKIVTQTLLQILRNINISVFLRKTQICQLISHFILDMILCLSGLYKVN